MPGYGESTYGDSLYEDRPTWSEPPILPVPPVPAHGAGPARFGLRPRVGLYPGHDPAYDNTPPRRTIQYPGTSADRYPGRGLYIFISVRRAVYPDAALYPGTGLYSGGPRARVISTLLAGAGRFLERHTVRRVRSQLLQGGGILSNIPLPSSDLPTTLSQAVTLASVSEAVQLASGSEAVDLASGLQAVEL